MIHLLCITPTQTPREVRKLARRYAMTGGYEISLGDGLGSSDLERLVEIYLPEYQSYSKAQSLRRSNNAYRILCLIAAHPDARIETRELLRGLL